MRVWLGVLWLLAGSLCAAEQPAPGPAASIGAAAHGCLQGAAALPANGAGWQVLRPDHNRFWGMPELVRVIEDHAARLRSSGDFLIGDMSLPRGGRMPSGHASHQTGLDADILFRRADHPLTDAERDDPDLSPVLANGKVMAGKFGAAQIAALKDFAEDPRVERIFVNPAIKRHLCQVAGADRTWLRHIRPWWGHAAHFHVRLACPQGAAQCEAGPAIPDGDGCGADLDWWFTAEANAPAAPANPPPPLKIPPRYSPAMPVACKAILPAK